MTKPVVHESNDELLGALRAAVDDLPRRRLHVHPDACVWLVISVQHMGLSPHVRVVPDLECQDPGKGWVETLTYEQWIGMRALVGGQAVVKAASLGELAGTVFEGTLLSLNHDEARLDLGDGDIRYLPWLTVGPVSTEVRA